MNLSAFVEKTIASATVLARERMLGGRRHREVVQQ